MVLPPELFDAVVDELGGDRLALKNCSLVARNLRARSQEHLFRDISLENASWCEKFYQTATASRSIPYVVRSLRLVTFPGQWVKDEPTLPLLLQQMVNLQHVQMFFVEWESSAALEVALRSLNNLTAATLTNVYFSNSLEFYTMLRYWQNLRHLTLRGLFFKGIPSASIDAEAFTGKPTYLETLRVLSTQYSDDASRDTLNSFLHPASPISLNELKELQIAPFQKDDMEIVRAILATSLYYLRSLSIDAFVQAHVVDEIAATCDPLQIHNLPSLTLEFSDKVAFEMQLEWWTRAFNLRAKFYRMQHVHLIIRLDETATIASPAFKSAARWRALDAAFARKEMHVMRELEITFDVGPAADKAALRHELNVFFEGACKQLVKEQRLRFKIRDIFQRLLSKST
ncbi:hypothetical protein CPB85DRAFT_1255660 [Mucidula mucida]|nr:hypothetical protein CPB85DRAFT_1255660 [Mucidula mucida]